MNRNPLKSGIFLLLIFLLLPLAGEPVNSETSLPHYFTAEELLNKDSVGRDFYETEPPAAPVLLGISLNSSKCRECLSDTPGEFLTS